MTRRESLVHAALILVALSAVAAAAPKPWFRTDDAIYEGTAQHFILPDCSDLQCVRVLTPWIVGRLPGPEIVRWKTFAVICTTGAALALGQFCVAVGLSAAAAAVSMWLLAFGYAPLLTLYNPYSPDPLMYLLAPLTVTALWCGRRALAFVIAVVGVAGKEVAAAPLWIFWVLSLLRRQWDEAAQMFAMALGATLVWVWVQLSLMIVFNYWYGPSKSVDLLHGGDAVVWWGHMGLRTGLSTLFAAFGGLFVLVPAGVTRASRELRLLAIATLPAALCLCYVQQPDRAVWNFSYAFIPFAALALARFDTIWRWAFVACYALAELRVGANIEFVPAARYALALSVIIAAVGIVASGRRSATLETQTAA